MPFAEVADLVAGCGQLIGPVEIGCAQPCLIGVDRMLDKEDAVVVGQEAGHQADPKKTKFLRR